MPTLKRMLHTLLLLCLVALYGVASAAPRVGEAVENFDARLINGKTVTLADYAGQPVVLVFWAAWCPPCKAEMADLQQLHRRYATKGIRILAVSLDDDIEGIRGFLSSTPVSFPVAVANDRHYQLFGPLLWPPRMFLIDRHGLLVDSHWGTRSLPELDAAIRTLL